MKGVLLDRDGVINALVYHREAGVIDSPFTLSQFRVLPRVPAAIGLLKRLGLKVAIVSNQPGIAKGHFSTSMFKAFERKMLSEIRTVRSAEIDGLYYCLHHPEAKLRKYRKRCRCRKPKIGLLKRAAKDLGISLEECYMIGDGIPDLLAGSRAGCRTVFIGRWKCEMCQLTEAPGLRPSFSAGSLWEAAKIIETHMRGTGGLGASLKTAIAS